MAGSSSTCNGKTSICRSVARRISRDAPSDRLAPHMKGTGKNNSAWWCGLNGRKLFHVQREDIDMSFGCAPDFTRRSVRSDRTTHERDWQKQLSLVVWTEWPEALPRATGRHRYVVRLRAGFHETLR